MKRALIALGIGVTIYGLAACTGLILYATGNIATGATHNDCAGIRQQIADEGGIAVEDVPQSEVAAETTACLAEHELTPEYALRTEYLIWPLWPALISAVIFLIWPVWARILENQELADPVREASRLELGT